MTRFSSDQLAKQFLQDFLEPLGTVLRNLEVPGEPKFVDLWFSPNPTTVQEHNLGLLGRIAQTPCLLEPFRNGPKRHEVETCLLKLLWVREEQRRKAKRDQQKLVDKDAARLWILATRVDQPVIQAFSGQPRSDWPEGIFFLPEAMNAALIAIDKLPPTPDTLWLRLLGKDATLKRAIEELLTLPPDDTYRSQVLELLVNWRISLQLKSPQEKEEQELMATLSQAYLDWQQRTRAEGERTVILRQLTHRFGEIPAALRGRVEQLVPEQLEALGELLLDFQNISDLENWLAN